MSGLKLLCTVIRTQTEDREDTSTLFVDSWRVTRSEVYAERWKQHSTLGTIQNFRVWPSQSGSQTRRGKYSHLLVQSTQTRHAYEVDFARENMTFDKYFGEHTHDFHAKQIIDFDSPWESTAGKVTDTDPGLFIGGASASLLMSPLSPLSQLDLHAGAAASASSRVSYTTRDNFLCDRLTLGGV